MNEYGMKAIVGVLKRNRVRWFGQVARKEKDDWVLKCMHMEVENERPRRRPRKTWLEVVGIDMRGLGLASVDTLNWPVI